jgi:hypothetical protein
VLCLYVSYVFALSVDFVFMSGSHLCSDIFVYSWCFFAPFLQVGQRRGRAYTVTIK